MLFTLIKRYAIAAIAIPLAAAGARKLSQRIEAKRGPSRGTRLLTRGADTLQGTFGRNKKKSRFALSR
ncbi:hypothetical protein [Paractinoplanes rishiriensis]|uniref:Uncharacterized protein n=1 Tax=Paractinoplanes rishiriensis TaxID=1050105 RepID=A0A919MQ28_9ACTN|nr:hypothetical protein [Actinoplanes rishiriensis]GIE95706.1 hypothetical protein Ari01nite_31710 [Actinoplanes rishiriensis]